MGSTAISKCYRIVLTHKKGKTASRNNQNENMNESDSERPGGGGEKCRG
jgi:hypothetical protein